MPPSVATCYLVGLAIDSSDNVFVMAFTSGPNFASTIYKFTRGGVQSTFGSIPTPSQSFGLAFDEAGNLFAADTFNQTVFKFAPDGTRSVFVGPSAFDPDTGPADWHLTGSANLFVSTESEQPLIRNDTILKFTPQGVRARLQQVSPIQGAWRLTEAAISLSPMSTGWGPERS